MPGEFVGNIMNANSFSNYFVGGNLTNAFAIGNIGARDDFWVIGAPAMEADAYPVITGNFLDSEGNPLFKIVRNVLTTNPRDCGKILGNMIGFEIHDGQGVPVLKVETTQRDMGEGPMLITTFDGTFFDKNRNRVAWSEGEKGLFTNCPGAMGFTGMGWMISMGMAVDQLEVAKWAALTHGAIHEVVTGEFRDQEILLDGKLFKDARMENCVLTVVTGDFHFENSQAVNCKVKAGGAANRILGLVSRPSPR